MENFFLGLGMSFTMSKLLPYIIWTIVGIIACVFVYKKSKKIWGKMLAFLVLITPFTIYFAINPIFQGDFTDDSRTEQLNAQTEELKDKKFTLIAMAGCPFCFQAIDQLKSLQKRHPEVEIEFLVASSDSTALEPYENEINNAFPIRLAENPQAIGELAQGRFPSFALSKGDGSVQLWNNNNFGVKALDVVVESFE